MAIGARCSSSSWDRKWVLLVWASITLLSVNLSAYHCYSIRICPCAEYYSGGWFVLRYSVICRTIQFTILIYNCACAFARYSANVGHPHQYTRTRTVWLIFLAVKCIIFFSRSLTSFNRVSCHSLFASCFRCRCCDNCLQLCWCVYICGSKTLILPLPYSTHRQNMHFHLPRRICKVYGLVALMIVIYIERDLLLFRYANKWASEIATTFEWKCSPIRVVGCQWRGRWSLWECRMKILLNASHIKLGPSCFFVCWLSSLSSSLFFFILRGNKCCSI